MARFRVVAVTAALITASALGVANAAWAAAPTNDTSPGATAASVGFGETLDTTEATTDAQDAEFDEGCGFGVTDASVWYTFVANGRDIIVDTSGSDYSTGVMVGVGTPGNLGNQACAYGGTRFHARAENGTYYILVVDTQDDGGGNGGNLSISFTMVPEPSLDFGVNPTGTVNAKSGVAQISGTYTCVPEEGFGQANGGVTQSVGRLVTISGWFYTAFSQCDGDSHPWSSSVVPNSGKFAGGKAAVEAFFQLCGFTSCLDGHTTQTVRLRVGKG